MDLPLVALVLAGGTGTRLYPASRSHRPKQFLDFGDGSLLAQTVDRLGFADEIYVLTREDFADEIHDHAPEAAVLTEPEPKDTGPALVYAAARIREQVGDCVLFCVPSDHHITGDFAETAQRAARVAVETENLVTVGIRPTRPATGYGYIEPGTDHGDYADVDSFHEKPDAETASEYVERGFLWNAGMFAWTPDALLREAGETPLAPLVENPDDFDAVEPVSIDYAVLERTGRASVVPATFEWDDLGTWDALARILDADEAGNAVLGDAELVETTNSLVVTDDAHVSVVGVSDLVVVAYDDRVLVVPMEKAQRVREIVSRLKADGRF
ncbi:mannose-1-phosphate guanylyltransferase [Haladaptatus sp. YSMS36]|uniref:mannose-1-phosphate guanylyltransferase n=1 Tax=Haladaptatus sp. YSMS36 TaxID=3033384 RepID=UPI0023E8DD42|nr:sugar phosphate nucleotidyltransferase [Haladaptatus sp. YSMS36]